MAIYAIGDIQGCYNEFRTLLDKLQFEPGKDQLRLVGDIVNRGPDSLATLRFVRSLGDRCVTVLGNHDLHLLAMCLGKDVPDVTHTMQDILDAEDRDELVDWLRNRPLAHYDANLNTLMIHAGVPEMWTTATTLRLADEVSHALKSDKADKFLSRMYGSKPDRWQDNLSGMKRLRCITNHLTRIRFCNPDGSMEFNHKGRPKKTRKTLRPWFEMPDRATTDTRIVFGHWSALGYINRGQLIGLDTGCVWGNALTAIRLDTANPEPVSVPSTMEKVY